MEIQWLRFDVVNSKGMLFSGQYSGAALTELFDSAMERQRIEPSADKVSILLPVERKTISNISLDFPKGFVGETSWLKSTTNRAVRRYPKSTPFDSHARGVLRAAAI